MNETLPATQSAKEVNKQRVTEINPFDKHVATIIEHK